MLFDQVMNLTVHEQYMRHALTLADNAAAIGEVPVGAVVVFEDEIIAVGHNLRERDQDPAAHAEFLAMQKAAEILGSWRLEGCTVYVTLEPCAMCAGLMVNSRIAGCVYGCTDPKGGFLGTLADLSSFAGLNHRFPVVSGVLEDESRERLQAFFRALRRR